MKTELAPIVRSTVVNVPPDVAFDVYFRRIAEWWPMHTHSVGDHTTTNVTFEQRAGGRIYENSAEGEVDWGVMLVWEPPVRAVHTWHPGHPVEHATEVEVTFAPHPDGTEVTIEHRAWHRMGDKAARSYANYSGENAWGAILQLFRSFAEEGR
jgi:hypothetical protein